jgi:hypothetical protein
VGVSCYHFTETECDDEAGDWKWPVILCGSDLCEDDYI